MSDLWIRTQDKSSLRKVNGVILLNLEWEERWALFPDTHEDVSKCMHLGTYKTKERALEVLGEIQKLLMNDVILFKDFDISPKDLKYIGIDNACVYSTKDNNSQIEHIHRNCVVFEMPEN